MKREGERSWGLYHADEVEIVDISVGVVGLVRQSLIRRDKLRK